MFLSPGTEIIFQLKIYFYVTGSSEEMRGVTRDPPSFSYRAGLEPSFAILHFLSKVFELKFIFFLSMGAGNSPLMHLSTSKSERKISLLKEMKAVTQSNNENSAWD